MHGRPTQDTQRQPRRRVPFFVIPFIVSVAFLMEAMDSNIITASIPVIAVEFGVTPVRMNLAITSYLLSLGVFIPASSWVADRFGAKRVFLSAMAVFALGSLLCGLATNLETLVAARILQGAGGALMTPVGRLILLRSFSKRELVPAISYMTMPVLIGPLIAPLLGGFLTTYASWRWIFFINLPIAVVGMLATARFIDDLAPVPRRRFDVVGFVLAGSALVCLQLVIENITHPILPPIAGAVPAVAAFAAAALFYCHARRHPAPALDISLFNIRPFRSGVLAGGLSRIGFNAVPFLLQLKLQIGMGYSPLRAASLVFLIAAGAISLKFMTPRILKRLGFRPLLILNAAAGGLLTFGFAFFNAGTALWLVAFNIFLFGVCRSLQFNTINSLIYAEIPEDKQSASVALGAAAQQVTMGLGVSVAAMLLAKGNPGVILDLETFDFAFAVVSAIPLLSAIAFLGLHPDDAREASGRDVRHDEEEQK